MPRKVSRHVKTGENSRPTNGEDSTPAHTPGAHAILLLDQAGWHGAKIRKVPSNISLMPLPPRAPELNGQENIWQFMRQNWLSNSFFDTYEDIIEAACDAWRKLIAQPATITSIGSRKWALIGHR